MAYSISTLPHLILLLLLLLSDEPATTLRNVNQPVDWAILSKHLNALKTEMYRLEDEKKFDSLNLLKPKFDINLKDAPDSIWFQYRSRCMYFGHLQ